MFFTTSLAFVSTYILVGFYSFGFHRLYNRRLKEIQNLRDIIQEEVSSLDIKIAAIKRELELERKELLVKIKQRKKRVKAKRKRTKRAPRRVRGVP